jgi:secreted trypsin-like serine protease
VHPRYVLSAAHCFMGRDRLTVVFGVDNVSHVDDHYWNNVVKVIQKSKIKNIHFHEGYAYPASYRDVALVELEKPVELTEQVYPVCLPKAVDPNPDSMKGDFVTLVGYGASNEGKNSTLSLINQKVMSRSFCASKHSQKRAGKGHSQKLKNAFPNSFKDELMCAGLTSDSKQGTCEGDSGAPLLKEDDVTSRFTAIGVLHGGVVECDNSNYPAVYNRIDARGTFEWIQEVLHGNNLFFNTLFCLSNNDRKLHSGYQ